MMQIKQTLNPAGKRIAFLISCCTSSSTVALGPAHSVKISVAQSQAQHCSLATYPVGIILKKG